MDVIALKTMLGDKRYEEIKNGDSFLGNDRCLTINGELYFTVSTALSLGYYVLPHWIEEI